MSDIYLKLHSGPQPAADWTTQNPNLAQFEMGVESDTGKVKVNFASTPTAWADLGYWDPVGANAALAAADVWRYKGATDCSTNPNYPAGDAGDLYKVSVAGKIGGASGTVVKVGDIFVCNTDGTTAGTEAQKGTAWDHFPAAAELASKLDYATVADSAARLALTGFGGARVYQIDNGVWYDLINPSSPSDPASWQEMVNPANPSFTDHVRVLNSPTLLADLSTDSNGNLNIALTEKAPGALTCALAGAGAGNVDNGVHRYKVTFVTASGETEAGTASSTVTVVDKTADGKVALSAIPTGSSFVTARKIYRTLAGGSTYKLLDTIADNRTTTYEDNTADASLTTTAPAANTTIDTHFTVPQNAKGSVPQSKVLLADYHSVSDTPKVPLTDLTIDVLAGHWYRITGQLRCIADGAGSAMTFGEGTATATGVSGVFIGNSPDGPFGVPITSLAGQQYLVNNGGTPGAAVASFDFTVQVNAGGTIIPCYFADSGAGDATLYKYMTMQSVDITPI